MSPRELENIRAYAGPFLRVVDEMSGRPLRAHLLGLAVSLGAIAGRMGSPGSAIREAVRIATAHCKVVAAAHARLRDEHAGINAAKP